MKEAPSGVEDASERVKWWRIRDGETRRYSCLANVCMCRGGLRMHHQQSLTASALMRILTT